MSEFRHMTTSFFFFNQTLQISARLALVNRKYGQIVFSYPDKTTMDYHCIL